MVQAAGPDGGLDALAERYRAADGALRRFDLSAARAGGERPYVALARAAAGEGADLVLKRAEPSPRQSIPLFASLDQHLLRKCPCPVWLLRDGGAAPRPPQRVVAAVDLPDPDLADADAVEESQGLNRTILTCAALLAQPAGRPVRVLHAWQDPDAGVVAQWSGAEVADSVARSANAALSRRRAALDALIDKAKAWLADAGAGTVELVPALIAGAPRRAVPEAVAELDADLLVMGTLARTGMAGVLIGNTAEDVLNAVDCSVCAVKPPGYVSPLLG